MDDQLLMLLGRDLDAAFERLVSEHQARVFSIALRLTGNTSDAEEVAQDVFMRAYRALGEYPPARIRELRLRPWLATIAVNLSRNRFRRHRPATTDLDDIARSRPGELAAADRDTPHHAVARRESTAHWQRLISALPDRYRVPLVLRYVDDLTFTEMSEVLGQPLGTLKAQVHRGLHLLRAAHDSTDRKELSA
jgi:RNA polymerase sigma-70 factor (ECF subfamily)